VSWRPYRLPTGSDVTKPQTANVIPSRHRRNHSLFYYILLSTAVSRFDSGDDVTEPQIVNVIPYRHCRNHLLFNCTLLSTAVLVFDSGK
ncbi:hypothetical protein J6590_098049, partial [Homalodisca vitripennis]